MKLTRIDMNSWIFDIGGQTILVDPWLVDPLVFYGSPWLFTAYHNTPVAFTPSTLPPIDLILISQGLDDHCHQPTLEKLDRQIPVVASPSATKTVQALGYTQVISLTDWQSHLIQDRLKITAVPGAPLQPGQVENGYVLQDLTTQETLYYEPHLFPEKAGLEQRFEQIDVAIAPVVGQIFPLLGQVVMGPEQALHLAKTLQPRFFVPTTMGDIRASGILPMLTKSVGSLDEFRTQLTSTKLTTELVAPQPGETIELNPLTVNR
jgi:L-ascorbate metabolism protein UlaG (beta-lactamase superfamily)